MKTLIGLLLITKDAVSKLLKNVFKNIDVIDILILLGIMAMSVLALCISIEKGFAIIVVLSIIVFGASLAFLFNKEYTKTLVFLMYFPLMFFIIDNNFHNETIFKKENVKISIYTKQLKIKGRTYDVDKKYRDSCEHTIKVNKTKFLCNTEYSLIIRDYLSKEQKEKEIIELKEK